MERGKGINQIYSARPYVKPETSYGSFYTPRERTQSHMEVGNFIRRPNY